MLDVGANKGQFTLACRTTVPEAMVIAFEPLESERTTLQSLFSGDAKVRIVAVALGSINSEVEFHVAGQADSSSVLRQTDAQATTFAGTGEVGTVTVPLRRLDDEVDPQALRDGALLKMDVQGYELEVLRGATGILDAVEWIYLEASFVEFYEGQPLAAEVIETVSGLGYQLDDIPHTTVRDGRALQTDLLFRRSR